MSNVETLAGIILTIGTGYGILLIGTAVLWCVWQLIEFPVRVAAYAISCLPPKQEMPEAPTAKQLEYEAGWKSIEDSLVELYGSAK